MNRRFKSCAKAARFGRLFALAAAVAAVPAASPSLAKERQSSVLVFTKAAGFVHNSIPVGVEAIKAMGKANRFHVDTTADPNAFNPANLAKYDAVIFLSTTGNVLPADSQRRALEDYIRKGGGYMGIHAASDMGELNKTWPWYLGLVGAAFKGHTGARSWTGARVGEAPAEADTLTYAGNTVRAMSWEPATVIVEDRSSPAVKGWGARVVRSDEWYGFLTNPRGKVHVIARVDESTYKPDRGTMGADHPVVWCQKYDGGRSVYTALGHPVGAWKDRAFLNHIAGGIAMATGNARFAC
jgi:type 1 glutamine amidotransferase